MDHIIGHCVPEDEIHSVVTICHIRAYAGHFLAKKTGAKVLQCEFYWSTMFRVTYDYCKQFEACQKLGQWPRKLHALNTDTHSRYIQLLGIDFIGPFPSSDRYLYILIAVNYISKWVEGTAYKNNDPQIVIEFVEDIHC